MKDDRILEGWTVRDSLELYDVALWSGGYFSANDKGHLVVCPQRNGGPSIDLKELVEDLRERGYSLPLLLRFGDILRERVREIAGCFQQAIAEYGYGGSYQGVYPIKVNQQHQVVEELLRYGNEFHLGLEVGSKPEMLVALALLDDQEAMLVCNGYKDEAYVEMALLAQKLGRRAVLVIDRYRDLDVVLSVARRTGIRPRLGVRAKLQAKGAGRWAESGGIRSKFGLTAREIVRVARNLEEAGMLDCLELLHFHMGSQVPSIRIFKGALREGARFFVELHAMGAPMKYFDVGGGLAVDYDGSKTNFHSSMNYTIQEYANDVVTSIQEACDAQEVPHPVLITESGRALVAHHTVLVFDVLDTNKVTVPTDALAPIPDDAPDVVRRMHETWSDIHIRNLREPYHDALQLRDEAYQLFNLGFLDLEGRGLAERLFYACCTKVSQFLDKLPEVPEELEGLERGLADTYYCNFSVFQSMPDSWAVSQLFPIMPIHRLAEAPSRRATLVDLTCDSDGKIDQFVDIRDVKRSLELHDPGGSPYYLGAFLIGAYQEILGDLHNLFGDTHAIHVGIVEDRYRIEHVQTGDTVAEVLDYVEFDRRDLLQRVQRACEDALWNKTISPAETAQLLKRYEEELNSYTYLVEGSTTAATPPAPVPAPASEATPRSGS